MKKINISIKHPSRVFNKHIFDKLNDYSTFTEVHYGGASSGKSHGVIQKVVYKACNTLFAYVVLDVFTFVIEFVDETLSTIYFCHRYKKIPPLPL